MLYSIPSFDYDYDVMFLGKRSINLYIQSTELRKSVLNVFNSVNHSALIEDLRVFVLKWMESYIKEQRED